MAVCFVGSLNQLSCAADLPLEEDPQSDASVAWSADRTEPPRDVVTPHDATRVADVFVARDVVTAPDVVTARDAHAIDVALPRDVQAIRDVAVIRDSAVATDVAAIPDVAMNTDAGGPITALRPIPVLGNGMHTSSSVNIRVIGTSSSGLNVPRDLAFNPSAPDQLWVVNSGDTSVTIFQQTGTASQTALRRRSSTSVHFLARPSGIAFGAPGMLATSPEEHRITEADTPTDFMGPTLWTSDLRIFDAGDNSHYDMLHNSPDSVGIAWERDNTYWVVDGAHQALTRYQILRPHALGGSDHSQAIVARYAEGSVGFVASVSSHATYDTTTARLFVADSGHNRIAVLDPAGATRGATITPNYDGDTQYRMHGGLTTFIDGAAIGMQMPSGIELVGDVFYVTDNRLSRIHAFDRSGAMLDYLDLRDRVNPGGLMGLALDPAGRIYAVDAVGHRVLEISAIR